MNSNEIWQICPTHIPVKRMTNFNLLISDRGCNQRLAACSTAVIDAIFRGDFQRA